MHADLALSLSSPPPSLSVCLSVCTDLTHVMPQRATACRQTSTFSPSTSHATPPVLLPPHCRHRSISSPLLSLLLSFASKTPSSPTNPSPKSKQIAQASPLADARNA